MGSPFDPLPNGILIFPSQPLSFCIILMCPVMVFSLFSLVQELPSWSAPFAEGNSYVIINMC